MAEFVVDTTRQSSHIPQIGDNDSGRFLKLVPAGALPQTPPKGDSPFGIPGPSAAALPAERQDGGGRPAGANEGQGQTASPSPTPNATPEDRSPPAGGRESQELPLAWSEDVLDHRHLVAAINGLFARDDFAAFAGPQYQLETELVRRLAGRFNLPYRTASRSVQLELDRPTLSAYPDFGLWVYRSPRCYLAVRCGGVGQNGNGGHAHNDQLAFVFALDGRSLIVDRGTYLYTPAPEQRNLFRSTTMHNTLAVDGKEQNPWPPGVPGLFTMVDCARARAVTVGDTEFGGEHRGFGAVTSRRLEFRPDRVLGTDTCELPQSKTVSFHLAPGIEARQVCGDTLELILEDRGICWLTGDGEWAVEDCSHSPAYGILQQAKTCRLRSRETEIGWTINWG